MCLVNDTSRAVEAAQDQVGGRMKRLRTQRGPGEVAEFETTVPHWFGSTGEQPAEVLSLFGRPGERMYVRT